MASTTAAGCNLRPQLRQPATSRLNLPRSAVALPATRGAPKLLVRASAPPSAGKQQSQSQFSHEPPQHAAASSHQRGGHDTASRAMPSAAVMEPSTDVTARDGNGNGTATDSVNYSSARQVELEILPSFVPHELTNPGADIFKAFLLSPDASELFSLPGLEPATFPQRQEPEAEEAEVAAEVAVTPSGYSKRMASIGDQFFESDLRPVVLFDGVCNLCNKWVNFLLDYDPHGNLRFASLQGDSGKALLRRAGRDADDHSDIVLVAHNKAYFGSDAILQIFSRLKPPFPLIAAAGNITPNALHNMIYKAVSESRYTIFGKADACRLFDPRFGQRFLPSELSQE